MNPAATTATAPAPSTAAGVLEPVLRELLPAAPDPRRSRIAVFGCCAPVHFPYARALANYDHAVSTLKALLADAPFEVVRAGDPFADPDAMLRAADALRAGGLDGVVLHHSTYAAGEIGSHFGRWLLDHRVPVLSWSIPDATGGRLEANSLCCQNFILNMWQRLGVPYAWTHGAADDHGVQSGLGRFARSARARQTMLHGRLLHVGGSRVTAFYDGEADELAVMRRFGLRFDRIDLAALTQRVEAVPAAGVRALRDALVDHPDRGAVDLPDEQIQRTLRFGLAILGLAREGGYLGCTVKSWPEMFDCYRCAIDGAVAMLNDHGVCTAEEGEMNGLISSLALNLVSEGRALSTLMDLSRIDPQQNRLGLWHCGASATQWLKPGTPFDLRRHSILENADPQTAVGLMIEFLLDTGPVTVARYQSPDAGRMFAFEGELHDAPAAFRGTYGEMEPADTSAVAVVNTIMSRGLDHHWSLARGHWARDLSLLNHWLGVEELPMGDTHELSGTSR